MTPWKTFVDGLPRRRKPALERPIRLVCFDLDGVLLDQPSSWVQVHQHFGVDNEASLTAFLRAEISEEEFIRRDIALWRTAHPGVTVSDIDAILAQSTTLTRGAKATVTTLQRAGVACAIASSGIESAALRVGRDLGIPLVSANQLSADDQGRLTGEGVVQTPLRDKAVPLRRFAQRLGVTPGQVASVGNSSPDIGMFRSSGLAIAFRPTDDYVAGYADVVLEGKSLREILEHVKPARLRAARSQTVAGGI